MSIQFPANPPLNATFDYDGKTYIWDGEKWTASAIGSFDEAYVNISGDTMTGDLTVPSLNGGPLAGFRNLITNPRMDIRQRGNSGSLTNAAYTIDRWLVYPRTAGQTVSWSSDPLKTADSPAPITSYLRLQSAAGLNGWNFEQRIELPGVGNVTPFEAGTSWTLSFWAYTAHPLSLNPILQIGEPGITGNETVSSSISSDQSSTALTQGAWTFYTFNFTDIAAFTSVPVSANNLRVRFTGPTDGVQTDFYISNVQFEPGSVATPFEMRPISTELALCQRYYQKVAQIDAYARINNGTDLGRRWYSARTVTMRTSPTEVAVPTNAALWGTGPTAMGDEERWILTGTARGSNDATAVTSITADAEL